MLTRRDDEVPIIFRRISFSLARMKLFYYLNLTKAYKDSVYHFLHLESNEIMMIIYEVLF